MKNLILSTLILSACLLQGCSRDALAISYNPFKRGAGSSQGWKTVAGDGGGAAAADCAQTVDLDGSNEYIAFSNTANRTFSTAFTVAYWRYVDALNATDTAVSKSDNNNRSFRITNHGAGGQHMIIYTSATLNDVSNVGNWLNIQSATTWEHIAVVYDGSGVGNSGRLKLYKNGSEVAATSYGGTIPSSLYAATSDIRIGADNGTTNFFDGQLHNVAIWSSALTAGQVSDVYDFGSDEITTDSANMVLYMRIEEGAPSFATIPDHSGEGDGTATNMESGDVTDTQQDVVTGSCE